MIAFRKQLVILVLKHINFLNCEVKGMNASGGIKDAISQSIKMGNVFGPYAWWSFFISK